MWKLKKLATLLTTFVFLVTRATLPMKCYMMIGDIHQNKVNGFLKMIGMTVDCGETSSE